MIRRNCFVVLRRRTLAQRPVEAAVVVIIEVVDNGCVGFRKRPEFVAPETFVFEYRMKCLDMGILVRCPQGNALVFDPKLLTRCRPDLTGELRAIVRPDDERLAFNGALAPLQGVSERLCGFCTRTGQSNVVVDYHAVGYVHNRLHVFANLKGDH